MTGTAVAVEPDGGQPSGDIDTPSIAADGNVDLRVWDLPVRLTHWGVAGAITVLSVTGYYIGNPFLQADTGTAYLMGTVRALHLAAAWIFVALVLARVAWAFVGTGTRWSRWDQFIPARRERRRQLIPSLKFYLFLQREPPAVVGHNPLAGLTYTVLYAMFGVQIVTGIALDQLDDRQGVLWNLTGWVFSIAPIPMVRLGHHLIMWLTIGFVVHHVYSAVLMDTVERSGLVSSIITGYKRLPWARVRTELTDTTPAGGQPVAADRDTADTADTLDG